MQQDVRKWSLVYREVEENFLVATLYTESLLLRGAFFAGILNVGGPSQVADTLNPPM